jgi:DMSO reductase anchor subunit
MERKANLGAQVFLVLLPAAVGCVLGGLVLDAHGGAGNFSVTCLSVALVLAVVGAAAPVLGIKKPLRSYRMLAGVRRSPLSRQAALVALFALLLLVDWAVALGGVHALWLGVLTVVCGAGAVLAIGLSYVLDSQPAWRHWSVPVTFLAGLLSSGVAIALVVALGWRERVLGLAAGEIIALILVLVGACALGLAAWAWAGYVAGAGLRTAEARAVLGGRGRWGNRLGLLLAIPVAGIAAIASFALPWVIIVSVVASVAGLFVLRRQFLAAAAPLNWKSEITWSLPPELVGRQG